MKKMIILAALLLIVSARAGDLTVDNLTVVKDTTIYGKMDFDSGVSAVGGTITTNGNYRIHTFLSNGTFEIIGGALTCDVLVVAGGGGGGNDSNGGGGGAGGFVTATTALVAYAYNVTIGVGGAVDSNGSNSVFNTIVAVGGGKGGKGTTSPAIGGSGGGGGGWSTNAGANGTTGQGSSGGKGSVINNAYGSGGGGGASQSGADGTQWFGGNGGDGRTNDYSGSNIYYAGGGGGGTTTAGSGMGGAGGLGGGGTGGGSEANVPAVAGAVNTGGGGGGYGNTAVGAAGGSGIVIVRYLTTSTTNVATLTVSSNGINQTTTSGTNVFMSKVGVGTDNPAEKLHVAGNLRVDGTSIVSAVTLGGVPITNWSGINIAAGVLMASNNFSDVENAETARSNLGLGSAATYDAFSFITTNGDGSCLTNITAVQVGAVSTNAGALLSANNLSELSASAATARSNLGLGSAATNETSAFLAPSGNGSQLSGITAAQVGALSTTGGVVNGTVSLVSPAGDIPMGVYTNQ